MSEKEIKNIIFEALKMIAPESEPSELNPDDDIRNTLSIDSFDFLQFMVAIEEKLGVSVPEKDYGKISTLETLLSYLTQIK